MSDAGRAMIPTRASCSNCPACGCWSPPPRYLLALKVAAARVDRDADDIRRLADLCGAQTPQEILDLTEAVIGTSRPLEPKAQFLIEELFGDA